MAQSVNLYEVEGQLTVLGARISTARLRRRWSTEELATRAGVEIRTISRLEEGDSGVGLGLFFDGDLDPRAAGYDLGCGES